MKRDGSEEERKEKGRGAPHLLRGRARGREGRREGGREGGREGRNRRWTAGKRGRNP